MSLIDEEIVVLVKHQNVYRWFVSERDFWVLDQDSWRRAFVEAGYDDDLSYAERFGIPIVNESNAADFLKLMGRYAVDTDTLRVALTADGNVAYPSLLVDFDQKEIKVFAYSVESPAFEDYLPPGWRAETGTFLEAVPEGLRYWLL